MTLPPPAASQQRIGRAIDGIWTRWWSESPASGCTCGVPSTTRAKSSTCWFSADATAGPRCGWCASFLRSRDLRRSCWSQTNCALTPRRSGVYDWPVLMNRGSGKTIGLRTRISLCGDESARCNASNRSGPPSDSSACTLPCTTPSTFNAISSLDQRSGSSEPRPRLNGGLRSRQCDRYLAPGLVLSDRS